MTPETVTTIAQFVSLVERVSNWPFASLLLVILIGPWVLSISGNYMNRRHIERIERFYNDNVKLVQAYEAIAGDLKDAYLMNAQAFSALKEAIHANQYCPLLRKDRRVRQSIEMDAEED